MARQTNSQHPPTANPADQWRSGRTRFTVRRSGRGRGQHWHFSGQQPDEVVRRVVRKHWIFLVLPALPLAGSILVLLLILGVASAFPANTALWDLLEVVAALFILGTGVWFLWKDFVLWWNEKYIITNKRIISSKGFLEPSRQETPLEKIIQIKLDFHTPLEFLLGFGTVHLYLVGGDLVLKGVPKPRKVKEAIEGISEEFKAKKPKEPPIPIPHDPEMAAIITELAKEKELPRLADADAHYPPPLNPDRLRGPRRTFGGVLRIPSRIRYFSGEQTVKYIQRSQYVLLKNLLLPALLMLLILPIAIVPPTVGYIPGTIATYWWLFMGLVFLALLVTMALVYINYVDDIYILTSRRIIDINRIFIYTYEARTEADYKNVRDVKVKVSNALERFLDIGDVYIETPGSMPDIVFKTVDHPFVIQDDIFAIKNHKEKEDKVKNENADKRMLHRWFGTVVTKLEDTTKTRSIPDLRNKDLLSAITCAQELGLDIEVSGEAIPTYNVPPGHVVQQNPPSGTMMEQGSKIEIVLSKKPLLVDKT